MFFFWVFNVDSSFRHLDPPEVSWLVGFTAVKLQACRFPQFQTNFIYFLLKTNQMALWKSSCLILVGPIFSPGMLANQVDQDSAWLIT